MRNVYMVQASTTYGGDLFKSAYLPYAAGLLVAYAWTDEVIKNNYAFKRFVFTREEIETVVDGLDNPAVIGFSNYIWNTEYNKALAEKVKQKFPECVIVFGGHNVPPETEFLDKFDYIDFLIHGEGEEAFRALLLELIKDEPMYNKVPNLSYRMNGKTYSNGVEVLTKTDYPSPYLTGVFDDIIRENPNMQLDAILETSRGCPRNCAYCDWGCTNSKVKLFPIERVLAEIDWFAENKIAFLWGADANFGAYDRDEEIVDHLVEVREKYGYPERIRTNYAKNKHEVVFRINQKFEKYGLSKEGATLSFQSLNPETLENIGRKNMSLEKFRELMLLYRNAGVTTYSELILGLPGETYESFCAGIGKLLEAGQHRLINVYNCEILPNSPMADKNYLEKYGIRTAEVVFLTSHSKAESAVVEKTKYVVGTDSMSEDEWIEANIFACFEKALHHYGILRSLAIYFHYEKNLSYEDFYNGVIAWCKASDDHVINNAYNFLRNFYKTVTLEEPMKLYYNEVYGKITWAPEHVAHMDCIYRLDEYYNAMKPLFLSWGIDEAMLDEIIKYEKCILKRPGFNNYSCDFTYDWHEYFTKALAVEYTPLKKQATRISVNNEKNPDSWTDYALEAAWFGKNGGTFNLGIAKEEI